MIKLSVAKGRDDKKYYKDFKNVKVPRDQLGVVLKQYAVSSYYYGAGRTARGFSVEGHRAARSIVGVGNTLLFDFDGTIDWDDLYDLVKFHSGWLSRSRSWSEECEKYHLVLELDRDLPLDGGEFTRWYKAVAQWVGLEEAHDPCMDTQVQLLAPHGLEHVGVELTGEPVCVEDALEGYTEPESSVGSIGVGREREYIDDGAMFTLSESEELLTTDEIIERVRDEHHLRVHCVKGLEHDGRKDTAFVRVSDAGRVFYSCSGGRCGETLYLEREFEPVEGEEEIEEVIEATEVVVEKPKTVETVWTLLRFVREILDGSIEFQGVYGDKPSKAFIESGLAYAGERIFSKVGVRRVNDELMYFNGRYWEAVFTEAETYPVWVQKLVVGAGFSSMAYSNTVTDNVGRMVKKLVVGAVLRDDMKLNVLNLSNCVVHVGAKKVTRLPHHPAFMFTSCLPYKYDEGAECPTWEAVVDKVMMGRGEVLQEAFGYIILRDFNAEKMVGFVGEGANGKTTVLKVLKSLVGRVGYSAVPIQTLLNTGSQGEYARAMLAGKLVNITNELTPDSLVADAFKDLISGEDIQARPIYGKPFVLETVPKQIVAMNTTDNLIKERTKGFERRLHLIPFDYTLKEADYDYEIHDKLDAELSGILNWALAGAERVIAKGRLEQHLASVNLLANVRRDADPMQQFVEEHVVLDKRDRSDLSGEELQRALTPLADFYLEYREYCELNGYKPLGRNKAKAAAERLGAVFVRQTVSINGCKVKAAGLFGSVVEESKEDRSNPFSVVT